jgi:hypothetical protein
MMQNESTGRNAVISEELQQFRNEGLHSNLR